MNIMRRLILKLVKNPKKRADFLRKYGYKIGDDSQIYYGVSFGSEPYLVEVGKLSKVTKGVSFITHDGGMHVIRNSYSLSDAETFGAIKIGNNVFIGNEAIVLPGVEIGDDCIIGAGSIVTKSFESGSVIAGIPARKICTLEEYYEKNKLRFLSSKNLSSERKKEFLLSSKMNKKILRGK